MKFKAPEGISGVGFNGRSIAIPADGIIAIENCTHDDVSVLLERGFTQVIEETAPPADEKAALIAEAEALGLKVDKRKNAEAIRLQIDEALKASGEKKDEVT